jgi:excisionase family DNA binding protein
MLPASAPKCKGRSSPPQDCGRCNGLGWHYDSDSEATSCDQCQGTGKFPAPARPADLMRLLNVKQVAGVLNVSKRSVVRLLAAGRLRRVKVGHTTAVDPRDLAEFIAGCGA